MTDQHAVYTPPAGYPILTPLYDIGVRLSTREKRWRRDLVDLIEPKCNEVLLDIGAGTGSLAPLLATKNPATTYFGIDPDEDAIQIARKKAGRAGIDAEFNHELFSVATVAKWPAPDIATLCLVLHQVPYDEKLRLLCDINEALKPSGRLFIADYGEQQSRLMRVLFRATIQQLDGVSDTQPNADGALVPLMEQAGFLSITECKRYQTITGLILIYGATKASADE